MRNILIISPETWSAHAVSKHHYAMTLAKLGHKVFFLDPPDSYQTDLTCSSVPGHPRLLLVRGPHVARGLRFYPSVLRRWLEARWLARFEKLVGCRIDTIWLFENSRFYDLRFAGDRLKIYHQVDLNQIFHPAEAVSTADICFCTTDLIRQRLLRHSPRVFKIHHGLAEFARPADLSEDQSSRFEKAGPHAVYIGNLEMAYLDVNLLAETARRFPHVCFHFVGGYSESGELRMKAGDLPNVVWWGKVGSELIPAILEKADVLLVTYQQAHWQDQASPHKFMEYLASGKVIVSTYTDEYKDKRKLLEMADKQGDFEKMFGEVIANLERFNSPPKIEARRNFASRNTYSNQVDRISRYLQESGIEMDFTVEKMNLR